MRNWRESYLEFCKGPEVKVARRVSWAKEESSVSTKYGEAGIVLVVSVWPTLTHFHAHEHSTLTVLGLCLTGTLLFGNVTPHSSCTTFDFPSGHPSPSSTYNPIHPHANLPHDWSQRPPYPHLLALHIRRASVLHDHRERTAHIPRSCLG